MEINIAFLFNIVLGVVTAYISWSLKELYNSIKRDREEITEKINKTDQNVKEISKDFEGHRNNMPEKYVLKTEFNYEINRMKEDFNREVNKLDMKLDKVRDEIGEINKKVSGLLTVMERGMKNS
ncbi:hypothetical protein [Anaerosolibacter sp.]|uniref:hypothetical protein n=1 Tax=Anaerosolibacter sp. TaxID=1872527 RepID=UPI0039EFEDB3